MRSAAVIALVGWLACGKEDGAPKPTAEPAGQRPEPAGQRPEPAGQRPDAGGQLPAGASGFHAAYQTCAVALVRQPNDLRAAITACGALVGEGAGACRVAWESLGQPGEFEVLMTALIEACGGQHAPRSRRSRAHA